MTIKKALTKASKFLNNNSTSPSLDAEILLSFTLNKPKEFLFTYPETKLTSIQLTRFNSLLAKRSTNTPIAHLTGHKEFYGLDFIVNKHTLIPRPETELIIDVARQILSSKSKTTIIDVGTGSGCIIITLAKILNNNYKYIAIDISKEALVIAEKNANHHFANNIINFLHGNLLAPILNSKSINPNSSIFITANLPYLTKTQVKKSPSIQQEPTTALISEENGLNHYAKLFTQIKTLINNSNPQKVTILCEIDPSQTQLISNLANKTLPKHKLTIKKDLAKRDRLITITI